MRLVEGVGAGAPPSEDQAEADRLEDTGESANGNGVKGPFLGENLGDELS